jgi:hypothetical protein
MRVTATGNVGVGTPTPNGNLHVHGAFGITTSGSGAAYFFRNRETNSDTGSTDYWAWYSQGNVARFWRTGVGDLIGITTNGNVGIGTTSPTAAKLVVNDTSIGTGVAGYTSTTGSGVYGQSTGSGGYGVYGTSAGYGVYGTTSTITYAGVRGVSTAQSSFGVWGTANAAGGVGVFGEGYNVGVNGKSTTGFAMRADGNAYQQRDKGGWVKAMLYVQSDGTIDHCYNALTGSSANGCGFQVTHDTLGIYNIDFGFFVGDRFYALSALHEHFVSCGQGCSDVDLNKGANFRFLDNGNTLQVLTFYTDQRDVRTNGAFMLIVF